MWSGQGADKKPKIGISVVSRKRRRTQHRRSLRMKRVSAELKPARAGAAPGAPVRIVLNDLSLKGVGIYGTTPLVPGMEVLIGMQEPRRIDLHGRVVWCNKFVLDHRVLTPGNQFFDYRMGIEFVFENDDEAQAVASFVQEIFAMYVYSKGDTAAASAAAPQTVLAAEAQPANEAAPAESSGADAPAPEAIPDAEPATEESAS